MKRNEKEFLKRYFGDPKEIIETMTLFSPEMTYAFEDKEFAIHSLEVLSGIKVTEEMKKEMKIVAEKSIKLADGKRGARLDVFISFPKHKINIEIQKARKGDEIPRSMFNMSRIATDIREGIRIIPNQRLVSIWICDFNPMKGIIEETNYYYDFKLSLCNSKKTFYLENLRYIYINGAFDWEKLEKTRPLTKEEKNIRDYVRDMRQSKPENIKDSRMKEALIKCKLGGTEMYNKIEQDLLDNWGHVFEKAKVKLRADLKKEMQVKYINKGKREGITEGKTQAITDMAKAMLSKDLDIDLISEVSGLSKEEVLGLKDGINI